MHKLILFLIISSINVFAIGLEEIGNKEKINYSSIKYIKSLKKSNRIGTGSISGTLVEQGTGNPIDDSAQLIIRLIGRADENSQWKSIDSTIVVNSEYNFNELDVGQYYLVVNTGFAIDQEDRPFYVTKFWNVNDESTKPMYQLTSEYLINLVENETITDINFTMEPAGLLKILIEPKDSHLVENAVLIDQNNQFFGSASYSNYTFIGSDFVLQKYFYEYLPVGNYRFFLETNKNSYYQVDNNENLTNLIFGSGECYECELELLSGKGTEVALEMFESSVVEPILNIGASISGKILTEASSDNNEGFVWVYNMHGKLVASTSTCHPFKPECSPEREYTVSGLAAGQYFISFHTDEHVKTFYGGQDCPFSYCDFENALPIRLLKNQSLQLKDIHLIKAVEISGIMNDADTGEALEIDKSFIYGSTPNLVEVYDEELNYKAQGYMKGGSRFSITSQLNPGKYYLITGSAIDGKSNKNYVNQVYDGIECEGSDCDFSNALLIDLTQETRIDNIHIGLHKGKSISGTVQDADHNGIMNIEVAALNSLGEIISSTKTKLNGKYKLSGLKSGKYYIRTFNGSKAHYVSNVDEINQTSSAWINQLYPNLECYNNLCNFQDTQLINLNLTDISGIDFNLSKGFKMKGSVKNSTRGTGVKNIEIKIFNEQGEFIENYFTDTFGKFSTAAMKPGLYKMVTSNNLNYVNQSFGGINCGLKECDPKNSEIITIAKSSIDGIDFQLTPGEDYYPSLSGLWYTIGQSGHGFQFEVIKIEDKASLYASWYVMNDGTPMWLIGTGPLNKDKAFIDLYITSGAQFPPNFNPEDVDQSYWGRLYISFSDRDNANLYWQTDYQGFENGELNIQRITRLSSVVKSDDSIDACSSGSYYNVDQSGQGILLEVIDGNENLIALTWYTYYQGQQFWLLATGLIDGASANNLNAIYTNESNFPPNFIENDVSINHWGTFNLEKIDNNNVRFEWMPNKGHADFGSGSIGFTKLTKIEGLDGCDS